MNAACAVAGVSSPLIGQSSCWSSIQDGTHPGGACCRRCRSVFKESSSAGDKSLTVLLEIGLCEWNVSDRWVLVFGLSPTEESEADSGGGPQLRHTHQIQVLVTDYVYVILNTHFTFMLFHSKLCIMLTSVPTVSALLYFLTFVLFLSVLAVCVKICNITDDNVLIRRLVF